jgi:hypothetical protein
MSLFLLLLSSFFLPPYNEAKFCEPDECITLIDKYEPLSRINLNESQLVGLWSSSLSGMAGSNLYFFKDHSYISTWWTDVMPEIIDDKGAWKISDGVIYLSSELDVSWQIYLDRRHLPVKFRRDKAPSIIGIDEELRKSLENVSEFGSLVGANALKKAQEWNPEEGAKLKTKILSDCWMPWWYECNEDPSKCPDITEPEKGDTNTRSR